MITVNTKNFATELEWVARFVEKRSSIPVLMNALLRKQGDWLYLTGTDLELGGVTSVEIDKGEECADFALTVPITALLKYLKKVDDRTLTLRAEINYTTPEPTDKEPEPQPFFTSCSLTVKHGSDGVQIDGLDANSFPELPQPPLQCMEIGWLKTAITRSVNCISNDESRFTLNGALIDVSNVAGVEPKAVMVATDGHRLSVAKVKPFDYGQFRALIPRCALVEVSRLGDSAMVSRDENHAFFTVGHRRIIARVLTGNFPEWERVVPRNLKFTATGNTAQLKKVLDRVSTFADERSRACAFTVMDQRLKLDARSEAGAATGSIQVTAPDFVQPLRTAFSATYVGDFLKQADETFNLCFTSGKNGMRFEAVNWDYVLMPMRIDDSSDPLAAGECEPLGDNWAYSADDKTEREQRLDYILNDKPAPPPPAPPVETAYSDEAPPVEIVCVVDVPISAPRTIADVNRDQGRELREAVPPEGVVGGVGKAGKPARKPKQAAPPPPPAVNRFAAWCG